MRNTEAASRDLVRRLESGGSGCAKQPSEKMHLNSLVNEIGAYVDKMCADEVGEKPSRPKMGE